MFSEDLRPAVLRKRLREIESAVGELQQDLRLPPTPTFRELVRKELAAVPFVDVSAQTISHDEINRLYELRSQLLDWTAETGFLGYFDKNAGQRYVYRRRLSVLLDMVPDLRGKRVLEIGCAAGILASLLSPDAREYVGIDVTETAIDFARKLSRTLHRFNARFFVGDAHRLAFPDGAFDVILSSEVFEHLIAPEVALKEFRRVLKPDGVMVVSTTTAVSPSDAAVKIIRLFRPDFYVDTEEQFDKKTYLAAQEKNLGVPLQVFRRVHRRFGFRQLTQMFRGEGFSVRQAKGAVCAFPPVYLAVYRFLPRVFLPVIREFEELLNELGIFKRFGSVTTVFSLRKT
jgi:ubiquinone/menaquinone biosynthesis C-methylase UbiE